MKNNTTLRKVNESWVLIQDNQIIELPSTIFFDSLWEAISMMLQVHIDDAGANLQRAAEYCRQSSKIFAGVSEFCQILTKEYEGNV